MHRYLTLLSAVAFTLVLLLLPGCGGDDDGPSNSADGTVATAGSIAEQESSDSGSAAGNSGNVGSADAPSLENDPSDAQPTDREQFVEQANKICEKQSKRIEAETIAILGAGKDNEEKAIEEALNDVIAPAFEQQREDLRKLGIPEGDEQQVEAIFDAMLKVVDEARADSTVFTEKIEPFEHPEELAVAYGLGSCGSL